MPLRERSYRTEAIILRRKDFGEADRVLTLFTPDLGKIRVVGKGIRKPRSRKAGHLELFTRAKLLLAKGRDLDVVTQAETIDAHRAVREDLLRGAHAAYVVELLDKFTPDEQESRELYNLLAQALHWLCDAPDVALTTRYYELHLLSMAGYQPELARCVLGGEKIVAEDQYFSVTEGGVVCPQCGEERLDVLPVSLAALKVLRYFQAQAYATIRALKVRPLVQQEVERLLLRYITTLLERQLKSVEFLRLIRREHPP